MAMPKADACELLAVPGVQAAFMGHCARAGAATPSEIKVATKPGITRDQERRSGFIRYSEGKKEIKILVDKCKQKKKTTQPESAVAKFQSATLQTGSLNSSHPLA
jgi:hypothetical protein